MFKDLEWKVPLPLLERHPKILKFCSINADGSSKFTLAENYKIDLE